MTFKGGWLVRKYYTLTFLDELFFTLPIWLIFGKQYLGISYLAMVLVFSMPRYFFAGLLQVPCGAWADRHGRKHAYLIGTALVFMWLCCYLLTKDLLLLALIAPGYAIGIAFRGGSLDAIMSSAAERDESTPFRHLASNRTTCFYLGRVVASATGGALYAWDERAPIAATLLASAVSFVIGLTIPNSTHVVNRANRQTLRSITRDATRALHERKGTWTFLSLYAATFVAAEIVWLSYQPLFTQRGVGFASLGIAFAVFSLLSAVGGQLGKQLMTRFDIIVIVRIVLVACGISAGLLALLPGAWVLIGTLPLQVSFGFLGPLGTTVLAARSPEAVRAAALSFEELIIGCALLIAGVVGALLLDHYSPLCLVGTGALVVVFTLSATLGESLRELADSRPPTKTPFS